MDFTSNGFLAGCAGDSINDNDVNEENKKKVKACWLYFQRRGPWVFNRRCGLRERLTESKLVGPELTSSNQSSWEVCTPNWKQKLASPLIEGFYLQSTPAEASLTLNFHFYYLCIMYILWRLRQRPCVILESCLCVVYVDIAGGTHHSVSQTTREGVSIVKQRLCQPITVPRTTNPLQV